MTMKHAGTGWIPADDFGRAMPKFSVNLLVRDVGIALTFYEKVLGAEIRHANVDFAALNLAGAEFMLHADHTYDRHPSFGRLREPGLRGTGAELRVMGVDPDATEARAKAVGAKVVQPATDYPHGWRDVIVEDPDGYNWAVGVAIPKP